MNFILILLAFLLGLLCGLKIAWLYHTIVDQERRIRELEVAAPQRLPHSSADSIENATAAILATKHELDLRQETLNIRQDMLDNALAHLQKARNPGKVK